ncbi:MAG: hypothetical protein A2284_17860 [Deltaproteobacteria bacterium RIFOXYA12_FULL_61_11]|nr:MAG: hypothetical protein A2284_17860 [Deltaproteobacteria bacterium RIFOXYA12_FULL_61_11]
MVEGATPLQLLTGRMALAALILGLGFALFKPSLLRLDRAGLRHCSIAGLLNTISMLAYYQSLVYLDVSIATIIYALYPMVALLLLTLFHERLRWTDLLRFTLSLAGVWLLVDPGGTRSILGLMLCGTSCLVFAVHVVYVQWKLADLPATTTSFYVISCMTVLLGGASLCIDGWDPPWHRAVILAIVWSAVVSTAAARILLFTAIARIGSAQTALLAPLESLLTLILAMLLLGERMVPVQYLGATLVLFSAVLGGRRRLSLERKS